MGVSIVRIVLGVIGVLTLIGAIALGTTSGGDPGALIGAAWLVVLGAALIIIAVIEVTRYRSDSADQATHGSGGGEPAAPEPRFRPTDETFVDPTTRRLMRVYSDPRTGERRYVAEG
jgi:hypothetical protein